MNEIYFQMVQVAYLVPLSLLITLNRERIEKC